MTTRLTTYLAQAFDAKHQWLDTDDRRAGYHTLIEGPRELLQFVNDHTTGTLHDFDALTAVERRICYWVIFDPAGNPREVFTTRYGRSCTKTMAGIKDYGPGCRKPVPVPQLPA
jgi:hypothetical protein